MDPGTQPTQYAQHDDMDYGDEALSIITILGGARKVVWYLTRAFIFQSREFVQKLYLK